MTIINYFQENYRYLFTLLFQHFYLFFISTIIASIIGIFIAICITYTNSESVNKIILNISSITQSIPSLAIIAIVFLFIGIGAKPAIAALILYSLVPIIFNTSSGLLNIDSKTIEAAYGMGLTKNQVLLKIKIPIAFPVIMAGIRSAATINIGTATIASVIAAGGLGEIIFIGLKLSKNHLIITGAVLTAILAIVIDIILNIIEKLLTSKGLNIKNRRIK